MHLGIDIASKEGTEIVAPANGKVVFTGSHGSYGNMIIIKHSNNIKTYYGHLSKNIIKAMKEKLVRKY